nr:hypothetical protein [uncultured Allomuricauda sp.]
MRYLIFLFSLIFLSCKAQDISNLSDEYKIVNIVLRTIHSKQFVLYDEVYNYNMDFALLEVYKGWYNKHKAGKTTTMASEDIEWILNYDDIEFISSKINSDTLKTRWNRNQIKNSNLIYASDRPDLVESTDLPRPPRVELSKPYLNEDKTKAMITRIIGGHGYLMLAKKVNGKWQLCGKIEYIFS